MNDTPENDPRLYAIPDIHGHAKGEHKAFSDERPIPLSARMLFLWFYHACRRGWPRFLMVTDHMNYLTFEDPAAINLVRRALKLAQAGDLYGAAETASVEVGHAAVVSEGLRRGMRYSIGAEVDNDPRSRPDAQNIVDAMKPDGMIRSVHFLTIDHPGHGPNWNWPFDNPEFADVYELIGTAKTWELYMATLLDAVERLPGNILGHFYVPALFGHWPDAPTLDGYEDQIVAACEARGMAIEFNTRFLYRDGPDEEKEKYLAAHRRLLLKCKAKNVGIAVGSDAHSPKDQGRAFATVLALLDECGINELVFPIAGRLARVALRIERKVEPIPEPTVLPPVPAEERKGPRKARPTEAPAHDLTPATAATADETPEPAKSKSRSKRSKGKTAVTDDSIVDTAFTASESIDLVVALPETPEPVLDTSTDSPDVVIVVEPDLSDAVAEIVTEAEFEPIVAEPAEPLRVEDAAAPVDAGESVDEREPVDDREPFLDDEAAIIVEPPRSVAPGRIAAAVQTPSRKSRPPSAAAARSKATAGKAKTTAAKPKPTAKKAAKPAAKAPAKKTSAKKAAVKKAPAKKAAPAKAPVKKAPAKKTAPRTAGSKKVAAKKSPAKKAPAKKPPQKRR